MLCEANTATEREEKWVGESEKIIYCNRTCGNLNQKRNPFVIR